MMLVYLVRQFTFDQVNHVAKNKNPKLAVKLDPKICKNLGNRKFYWFRNGTIYSKSSNIIK